MSNLFRNLAARGGLSFAHLGRGPRAEDNRDDDDDSGKSKKGKRAEDDDDDEQQDRDNGNSKKGKRAEGGDSDNDDDDDRDNGKRGKRAEDDRDDDDDDSGKGKKGKRAEDDDVDERAEEDDDDEEEMRGNSAAARARRRERARCAAIFASKAAGRNPVLACKLAFNSSLPRSEALAVLEGTPAPEGSRGRRQNPNLGIDSDRSPNSEQSIAASWDVAFKKAGATRRR